MLDPAGRRDPHAGAAARLPRARLLAGQVLADVLLFSFSPLYPAYAEQDERLWGLSALTDQRLAGLVMMVEQVVVLGTCAALPRAAHAP